MSAEGLSGRTERSEGGPMSDACGANHGVQKRSAGRTERSEGRPMTCRRGTPHQDRPEDWEAPGAALVRSAADRRRPAARRRSAGCTSWASPEPG